MILYGLDVSSAQGTVPWQAVKDSGCVFGAAKCQQGNDGKDPQFEHNLAEMKRLGIIPMAYHFVYPLAHIDPVAQAKMFFAASPCGSAPGELPPLVDFEWPAPEDWAKWGCTAPQMALYLKALLEQMTLDFGVKPIVYLYPYFCQSLVKGGADLGFLAEYGLCIADYSNIPLEKTPYLPPWDTAGWVFRQYDGNGGKKLPNGVDSDFMVFNGGADELSALTDHGILQFDHTDAHFIEAQ